MGNGSVWRRRQTLAQSIIETAIFREANEDQTTSSVALGPADSALQTHLLKFIRKQHDGASKSIFKLRGQHDQRDANGELRPRAGVLKRTFRFDDTTFLLDEPIIKLLDHIKAEAFTSEKLTVTKISVDNVDSEDREKRPFSSVDLEPAIAEQILREVTDFFHKDTKKLYMETSRNWRHGFLFSGPPGTGKTSLSFAIASEAGVPLAIINFQGMSDKDLEDAFKELPVPCVVLIEDIDAFAADTESRAQPTKSKAKAENANEQSKQLSEAEVTDMIAQYLGQFRKELVSAVKNIKQSNDASTQEVISLLQQNSSSGFDDTNNNDNDDPWGSSNSSWNNASSGSNANNQLTAEKKVTLSGLLNVIDGAAATNGRLLIMTANHPELLDPALTRACRCDSKFHIGYATPATAEQTFKRIFGADTCKKHSAEAIDRYAKAFRDQFPENSEVATCDLARYCGLYRNRPVDAVRDFLKFLEVGMDMFAWSVEARNDNQAVNVARPFDEDLLREDEEDFVKLPVVPEVVDKEPDVSSERSLLNLFSWFGGGSAAAAQEAQPASSDEGKGSVSVFDEDLGDGFSLDDVEFEEWPELSLYDMIPSFLRPAEYAPDLELRNAAWAFTL